MSTIDQTTLDTIDAGIDAEADDSDELVWVVTHNIAGYLPEADPMILPSFADAKQACIDEMRRVADGIEPGAEDPWGETYAENLTAEAEELNLSAGPVWGTYVDTGGEHSLPEYWEIVPMARDEVDDLEAE